MARRSTSFYILLFAIAFLSTACNLQGSNLSTETTEPWETVPPIIPEIVKTPGSEVAVTSQAPKTTSLPVLERPGLEVVYTSAENLWLWTEEGKAQLTSSGDAYSPRISPDGRVVAFLRPVDDFHLELWAVDTDRTAELIQPAEQLQPNERRLVNIADLDAIGGGVRDPNAVAIIPYHYQWVPGTHTLAFNTQQVFRGPGLSLLDDLNLVDANNLEIKYQLLSGWGGEFVYSPDGSQIAISTPTSIFLCKADGSDYRKVLDYEVVNTYSEYRFYARPIWSQDGALLRVAIPPSDPLARPAPPTSLWFIPTDGSPASQVGNVMAVPFFEQSVAFSPDLSRLIFLQEVGLPSENLRELHIAVLDGSGDWTYSKYPLMNFLGWSVDSNHFAFNVGEDQEAWLGSLEALPTFLSQDPYGIIDLRWVDARNFLYVQQRSDGFKLFLGTLDGGAILLDAISGSPLAYDFAYP